MVVLRALILPHPPSLGSFLEVNEALGNGGSRFPSLKRFVVSSSDSRSHESIPKLRPFSRNLLERALKEPPLIQKTVSEISDYCTTLDGDECYSCWRAYFELKELEEVAPKLDLERTIVESNGLSSLIRSIHRSVDIYNLRKEGPGKAEKDDNGEKQGKHIPDGLPKTQDELEEEEKAKMADSAHTRLLRVMGKHPAWYTPAPDHQTD